MSDMSWAPKADEIYQELSSSKKELRVGLYAALAFFVGLLGWAAMTPMDAGAMAEGIVAVSGSRQVVQHRDGGIVTGLNVVEGQMVKQGDLLVKISASELVATERGMTGELVTLLAQRSRLQAERDGLPTISDPVEFAALAPEDRNLANDAMKGQRLLFAARRDSAISERNVLEQRVRQHDAQIGAFNHQMRSNREQQRLIGEELSGMRTLAQKGFVPVNRIRAMERNAAELDGNYGAYQADSARSEEAIGEARMQMVSAKRQRLEQVATELRDVQVRLDEIQPKLLSTREQLARAMVRAPATGRIVGLNIHTVGGVVAPGQTLMEIVPEDRTLVVNAKASPNDADDLKIGMSTQVRFSALQERNLPVLHGQISKVSADSLEDERSGMHYFSVEVTVPPAELDKIRAIRGDVGIRAGIPAEVMVPLRKRTALTYLTEPLTQMFWRAGREH